MTLPGLALVFGWLAGLATTPELVLKTRRGTPLEERKKAQLERLAQQYDLRRYTLTREIVIEQGAVSHSMPVLTLNCRFLEQDDLALSVYLHEQGHWLLAKNRRSLPRLFEGLEALLGADRARAVLDFKKTDHYTALYATALERRPELEAILRRRRIAF